MALESIACPHIARALETAADLVLYNPLLFHRTLAGSR